MSPKKKIDPRTLPRKPAALKKTRRVDTRLTASEHEELRTRAAEAEMAFADFVRSLLVGKR